MATFNNKTTIRSLSIYSSIPILYYHLLIFYLRISWHSIKSYMLLACYYINRRMGLSFSLFKIIF